MAERATVETIDKPIEIDNPLDAFLLEAQAFGPSPARRATAVALQPTSSRGPATVHDISAFNEKRVLDHVSKESAEVRRRLLDLKQALEHAIIKQSADINRLTWTIRIAIYILLAFGLSQIGLILWTRH